MSADPRYAAAIAFFTTLLAEWNHGLLDAAQQEALPHFVAALDALEENEKLHGLAFRETQRAKTLAARLQEEHGIHADMEGCETCKLIANDAVIQDEVISAVDRALRNLSGEVERLRRVKHIVDAFIAGRIGMWKRQPKRASQKENDACYARWLEAEWFKDKLVKEVIEYVKPQAEGVADGERREDPV